MTERRPEAPAEPTVEVEIEELLRHPSPCVVDVRSPAEYAEDHLPGSHSVPLLDDEERAVVGSLYRSRGPGPAREWGESLVHGRLEKFTRALRAALEIPGPQPPSPSPDALRVILCARCCAAVVMA